MSALGQKQTLKGARIMSALPPKADIGTQSRNVRLGQKQTSRHLQPMSALLPIADMDHDGRDVRGAIKRHLEGGTYSLMSFPLLD